MDPRQQPRPQQPFWQPFSFSHPPRTRVLLSLRAPSRGWTVVHSTVPVAQDRARTPERELCLALLPDAGASDRMHHETVQQRVFLRRDYAPTSPGRMHRLCYARRAGTVMETLTLTAGSLMDCRAALQAALPVLHLLPAAPEPPQTRPQTLPPGDRRPAPVQPGPVLPGPARPVEFHQVPARPAQSLSQPPVFDTAPAYRAPVRPAAPAAGSQKRSRRGGTVLVRLLVFLVVLGGLGFGANWLVNYKWGGWDAAIDCRFSLSDTVPGFPKDAPKFSTRAEVCRYLFEKYETFAQTPSDEDHIELYVQCRGEQITDSEASDLFYNATNAFWVGTAPYGNSRFCVTLKLYPGERMLQAYQTGDESRLSADEKKALATARTILKDAQSSSKNNMELEIALHDAICERVTYDSPVLSGTEEKIKWNDPQYETVHAFETAVGALLNGKANCQGYSDAFYLLASMAGFTVSRQSGTSIGSEIEPGGPHRFNTICLDGKWYIVDVTFDDPKRDSGPQVRSYCLLNAGKDIGSAFYKAWDAAIEPHPIEQTSGPMYYYNYRPGDGSALDYQKRFTSIDDLLDAAVRERQQRGRTDFSLMLDGQQPSEEEVNAAGSRHPGCGNAHYTTNKAGTIFYFKN